MKYAIAAGHNATADTAEAILLAGGNAVDAAIAAYLTAFVAEPCMASGGGGAFANIRSADGKMWLVDFFCQTPKVKKPVAALEFEPIEVDFGTAKEVFYTGKGSVGVPGSFAGLFAMHERFGTIPMKELVQLPIQYAKEGALIDDFQSEDLELLKAILAVEETGRRLFYKNEKVRTKGDYIRMPDFANFLETIALEGVDLFYKGEIAQVITKSQEQGGYLTMADFEDYEVEFRRPLSFSYRGKKIFTNPLPSIGGSLLAHYLTELESFKFSERAFSNEHLKKLFTAFQNCESINRRPAALAKSLEQILSPNKKHGSTTHFNIVDQFGNAVSLTATVGEGSGIFIPGTDIQLNNMLGEGALMPDGFHSWDTDVRLSSMMAPTLMTDMEGQLELVTGTGGAGRIPAAITQVIHYLLDYEIPLEKAVNAPRVYLGEQTFNVEPGFEAEDLSGLDEVQLKNWNDQSLFFGGVHSIEVKADHFNASGDLRRDGVVRRN